MKRFQRLLGRLDDNADANKEEEAGIKDDFHSTFTSLLYFCQQLFQQGSQKWSLKWVTIMSRSLSDWEEVYKEKGEVIPVSHKPEKRHSLCAAKGRQMVWRPASCEGLQTTGSHSKFSVEQRSDSWPWKKVTLAPVWRINYEGECLETSWLMEAAVENQEKPL